MHATLYGVRRSVIECRFKMNADEQDKRMMELATEAAGKWLHKYDIGDQQIGSSPETYLQYSIPYLTVRTLQRQEKSLNSLEATLQRQEKALDSLKADSRWIKGFAIVTGILTAVLAYYAWRLDTVIHSLR
jgi:hypothetical protein